MTDYAYRGTGRSLTGTEAAQHLTQRPALATSREARAATPAPTVVPGAVIRDQAPPAANASAGGIGARPAGPATPQQIKGARKVSGFPERSKYPFRQIAEDGGVWELDPAVFKASTGAIGVAAGKWARDRGYTAKIVNDSGMTYVQFTRAAAS